LALIDPQSSELVLHVDKKGTQRTQKEKMQQSHNRSCNLVSLAILAWHGHPIHVKLGQPSSACCEEEEEEEEEEELFFLPIDLPASPKTLEFVAREANTVIQDHHTWKSLPL
jgi:hypothetical protein